MFMPFYIRNLLYSSLHSTNLPSCLHLRILLLLRLLLQHLNGLVNFLEAPGAVEGRKQERSQVESVVVWGVVLEMQSGRHDRHL
jgi:hypothetical protein